MKKDERKKLLEKYFEGSSSLDEEARLRKGGTEDSFEQLVGKWAEAERDHPVPEIGLGNGQVDKKGLQVRWWHLAAVVLATLVVGYAIGWQKGQSSSLELLKTQFESQLVGDRIGAVQQVSSGQKLSSEELDFLLDKLGNDESINVRLVIISALYDQVTEQVLAEVLDLIGRQESPLVQMSLADLIVAYARFASDAALQDLLENEQLMGETKQRIEHGIAL